MNIEKNPFDALPNIDLPLPPTDSQLGVLGYQKRVLVNQVWPEGHHTGDVIISLESSPDQNIATFQRCLPTLAWVTIQACPIINLPRDKNYGLVTEKWRDLTLRSDLTLRGYYETIYPTLYCVERSDMPTLLTADQILQEGFLRPDMYAWVAAIKKQGRYHDSRLDPFYKMLQL